MRYSGFIDNVLAEAAYAKKSGDASWLMNRLYVEDDPIKRKILQVVCNKDFIESVRRDLEWMREQKGLLEDLAEGIEDDEREDEAEEVNQQLQSFRNTLTASSPYDDDDEEEEKHDEEESDDGKWDSIKTGWKPRATEKENRFDPDMGIQNSPPRFEEPQWEMPKIPDWYKPSDKKPEIKVEDSVTDRNGKQTDKDWEEMRKEAQRKLQDDKQNPIKQFEKELKNQRKNPEYASFGEGPTSEEIQEVESRLLAHVPKSLKKLARKIGRSGGTGASSGKSFSRASKSDISGITVGDDLNSLLPTEIAMLAEKGTQDIFYRNYAEKRLQVFASASSGERKKEHKDGPVIICLDTSSSMNGEPATIAKMLSIAVAIYAMRRKRRVMIIKYSYGYECETFTSMKKDSRKLLDFLRWHGTGGNDENRMFTYLFEKRLPQEPAYDTADILCISDFGWCYLDDDVQQMIKKAKEDGMIFYGLGVNMQEMRQYGIEDSMDICDSKWIWEANDCYEIDDNIMDRERIK